MREVRAQGYNQISDMKKEYMKPTTHVVELQYKTQLLQASRIEKIINTDGFDSGDEIDVSNQGGGSDIWDR